MDSVQPLADLAREETVFRAEARLFALRNSQSLPGGPQTSGPERQLFMSSDPQVWRLLRTGARPAAENMALDELLLESAPQRGQPLLRFYAWAEPAATFGYSQKFSEVQGMTTLRPLVRRPTGGGLAPHEADWTYSLVFPPSHRWYELKAIESYRRLHQWIQSAFKKTGLGTELAPRSDQPSSGQCFAGAEQFDVLWEERKIAGAAQRRTRQGLLIQGSVQPPLRVSRPDWETAFCEAACEQWGVKWLEMERGVELEHRALKLAAEKYATRPYTERR